MNFLANSITALSLICGFASIIFSVEGHFTFASWAIILAVIGVILLLRGARPMTARIFLDAGLALALLAVIIFGFKIH